MARETNIHAGHRSAMRRKFVAVGESAFHAHELIEMLLYYSIPLCDTNPTAHRVIESLGGIDRVLSSNVSELSAVKGVGASSARLISLVKQLGVRAEKSLESAVEGGFCDYEAHVRMTTENATLRLLLLDAAGCLLADASLDDVDAGAVFEISRETVKKALHHRASTVVLIRRCDGRVPQPTSDEMEMLNVLRDALSLVDVRLADYVLVSGERLLRFARAFPECVYCDPDVALTFRVPVQLDRISLESDTELLYALLSYAGIRDRETVQGFISQYGGLGRLLSTPVGELMRIGLSERAAVLISLSLALYARGEIAALSKSTPLDRAELQADYFARHYIGVRDERLSMLLLDRLSRPIAFVPFGDGGVGNTSVDLRKIVELALFHGAASVSLAHNHPGGTLTPSSEDVLATKTVENALFGVGVTLDEHYILVGRAFTPIRLYSEELFTVRSPEFYGESSFREIRRQNAASFNPIRSIGIREQ